MPPVDSPQAFLAVVLQSFVTQTGAYFVLVSVLFLVFWRFGAVALAHRKLQKQRRVDGKQIRFELKNTLAALLAGTVTAAAIMAVAQSPYGRFTSDIDAAGGPLGVALSLVAMILVNDLWFYGWHRLLHTPFFFRHVHAVHHKSVDVNPFSSYSFHLFEAFILSAWFIVAALVVPLYLPALAALQVVGMANNLMSHLGYELFPTWLMRIPILRLTNTSTFHNLHHTHFNGNFGLHTRIWDRLFGTEVEGYERAFIARDVAAARKPADAAGPA
jgi:sterol desaturase/sphingolipid hydroxylase (fatty acid hydroxylase superfamily)